ncbi:hypothetical protein AU476_12700 [Cupriavidus sp. UYMSc13B]|nr:hypothetical protein AU476_12700 [Cupriavidus sp. UYMSc13B]
MLGPELHAHVEHLFILMNMPDEGRQYVREVIASGPSRETQNRFGNSMSRFPSRKMGDYILVESTEGELAKAILDEQDDDVIAFFPQPAPIQVDYYDEQGVRRTTRPYHPDFLEVRNKGMTIIEVRDEARLYLATVEHPAQYQRDELGRFHFLPAERTFASMGIPYLVVSNSTMPRQLLNNCRFLRSYLREDTPPIGPDVSRRLANLLEERKYVPYMELLNEEDFTADQVLTAVASGVVHVDLNVERLDTPSDLTICVDKATSAAFRLARQKELEPVLPIAGVMRLRPDTKIRYDGAEYTVVLCGEREISVRDQDGHLSSLPLESVIALNNLGSIESDAAGKPPEARKMLHDFDSDQFARAMVRYNAVADWDLRKYSASSLREFKRRMRGTTCALDAIICLMDNIPGRGDRSPRFCELEHEFWIKALTYYNTPECPTKLAAYAVYQKLRDEHYRKKGPRVQLRSYQTFCKDCNKKESILLREGEKALYQKRPLDVYFALLFPVHGTRPHEVCHIDHTIVPLATTDLDGLGLGKTTVTLGVDGATRHRRAFWLSYDPPSAASVLMVLRDYVRRHGRLPEILVVDNAKEFRSAELILFCGIFGIELRYRPPGQPRGGAIVERAWVLWRRKSYSNFGGTPLG